MKDLKKALEDHGFIIGKRDPKMNYAFEGEYMVAEPYEPGHMQADGRGGVWCVVGNDLQELLELAEMDFLLDLGG